MTKVSQKMYLSKRFSGGVAEKISRNAVAVGDEGVNVSIHCRTLTQLQTASWNREH